MFENLGMWHPQIVHFVVALLFVGVIFRIIALTGRFTFTNKAATTLILIGTVAAWFAVASGEKAHGPAERIPGARETVEEHEEWGERTRNLFTLILLLEIGALATAGAGRARLSKGLAIGSAVIGLAGLWVLYEAAEHGGEIVYVHAGGPGVRSGNPKDVENLLVAGLYHQAALAVREKRIDEARRLIAELELRRPGDRSVVRLKARADSLQQ